MRAPPHSIRYVAGVRDEVINQIGLSIISAMMNETAAGRIFVETASATLPARLLQTYCDSGSSESYEPTAHRLDQARLRRVLDYISMNIDREITLAQLAGSRASACSILRARLPAQWASRPIAMSAACAWRTRWRI
jgi:AraC family transcriptional regulator